MVKATDDAEIRAIGQRLQAAREAQGRTQDEMAEVVGISRVTLSHWEVGSHEPRVWGYCQLLDQLRLSWEDALGRPSRKTKWKVPRTAEEVEKAVQKGQIVVPPRGTIPPFGPVEAIPCNLPVIRQRRGLDQAATARAAGIDRRTLMKWEGSGRGGGLPREPTLLGFVRLLDCLEVSLDVVLGRAPLPPMDPQVAAKFGLGRPSK